VHVKGKKLQSFWEKKLRKAKLTMDRGRGHHVSGHKDLLIYVGSGEDVDALHEQLIGEKTGTVKPKGHGPDTFEGGSEEFNHPKWPRH
jgi:hypothetical protein